MPGTSGEGLERGRGETRRGALGNSLSLSLSGPHVRTRAPLPSPSPAPPSLSQKCPPDVRGLPPRPRVPRGAAPASAESAVGPSPFPRWVRGGFFWFFFLRLRSFSQPKFLGLFSPKVSGGQTTMPAPFPPHCPLTPDHPTPPRHGIISELIAFQEIGAAPRHPIPLRPSLPDPGS